MIKKIHVVKYRKLQDMDFDLSKGINVISGTNGTCKTSLLHMVSNAYQAVTKKCDWLQDAACLDVIKQINSMTNPKIESLTKGDKTYNDPANGAKGTLFTVDYYGQASLEFRKHNSKLSSRYAVKPWYRPGTTEKLPFCPVIYLGLTRLYPFGEYLNDEAVEKLKKNLPVAYQNEIADRNTDCQLPEYHFCCSDFVESYNSTPTKGQVLIGLAFFYCRSLSVARNCASSAILSSYSQKDLFLTTLQEVPI